VSASGLEFAAELGKRCASEGLNVVSGDARGVDRAAMDGALEEGGSVTAVLVDALTKAVLAKRNRDPRAARSQVFRFTGSFRNQLDSVDTNDCNFGTGGGRLYPWKSGAIHANCLQQ
jgi:predicted Rossmann-fold nucleotide-binding protein